MSIHSLSSFIMLFMMLQSVHAASIINLRYHTPKVLHDNIECTFTNETSIQGILYKQGLYEYLLQSLSDIKLTFRDQIQPQKDFQSSACTGGK